LQPARRLYEIAPFCIARFHGRSAGVDPLETVTIAEVTSEVPAGRSGESWRPSEEEVFAYSDETCRSVAEEMATSGRLSMPVIERETGRLCGHISAAELLAGRRRAVNRETERSIAFLPVSQAE
jgi:CIC family chloride channel protein